MWSRTWRSSDLPAALTAAHCGAQNAPVDADVCGYVSNDHNYLQSVKPRNHMLIAGAEAPAYSESRLSRRGVIDGPVYTFFLRLTPRRPQ